MAVASSWWIIVIYALLGLTLWCLTAHCIFMPFCTCLKRPHKIRLSALSKNPKGWLLNGAHRGGSCERPENTTAAFKHAMSSGMNLMECDVHLSKDGEVVIAHDADLERMCGPDYKGKFIHDYDFKDLPNF